MAEWAHVCLYQYIRYGWGGAARTTPFPLLPALAVHTALTRIILAIIALAIIVPTVLLTVGIGLETRMARPTRHTPHMALPILITLPIRATLGMLPSL